MAHKLTRPQMEILKQLRAADGLTLDDMRFAKTVTAEALLRRELVTRDLSECALYDALAACAKYTITPAGIKALEASEE